MRTELTFFGTGTSQGVPIIGCRCPVCTSQDSRDKRFRSSAFVRYGGISILIDAGPDFRSQMLRFGISHLDAILLTHNHKDHTGGLDDVRSLNYIDRHAAEIWCEPMVLETLKTEYGYAFTEKKYPGAPEWHVHLIDENEFSIVPDKEEKVLEWVHDVGYRYRLPDGSLTGCGPIVDRAVNTPEGVRIIPIRGWHGMMPVLGFRFGNIAYITDMSAIPEDEFSKLEDLEHLTLNTVSYKPHHSHFSLDEALEIADRVGAKNTWLTHLSHTFPSHPEFSRMLSSLCRERHIRSSVQPAYDGLTIVSD